MIDRLILSAVLGTVGFNGFFPEPPPPPCAIDAETKSKDEIHQRHVRQETQEPDNKKVMQTLEGATECLSA